MNRSYSKIRHIQEANQRLEKRFLGEQTEMVLSGNTDQQVQQVKDAMKMKGRTMSADQEEKLRKILADNPEEVNQVLSKTKADIEKNTGKDVDPVTMLSALTEPGGALDPTKITGQSGEFNFDQFTKDISQGMQNLQNMFKGMGSIFPGVAGPTGGVGRTPQAPK